MKETWRDEHMKTLCAFASTGGGTLEIGRDDKGVVTGVRAYPFPISSVVRTIFAPAVQLKS